MVYNKQPYKAPFSSRRTEILTNFMVPELVPLLQDLLNQNLSVRLKVTGQSMRPFLLGGEVVVLRNVKSETLRIGDLILFVDNNNYPIMHRIVCRRTKRKTILQLQTKGDGLQKIDTPIYIDQVLGKIEKINFPQRGKQIGYEAELNLNHPWERTQATVRAYRSICGHYFYRLRQVLKFFY
jgi:signal peptidase I